MRVESHEADHRRFLSVPEVARLLGVSPHTIYGMISERRLPFRYVKFGRRVLVDRRELDRWVARDGVTADERRGPVDSLGPRR